MAQKFKVVFSKIFKKAYQRLPPHLQKKFDEKLNYLLENPRHPSLQIHKIGSGSEGDRELYINMSYRAIFFFENNTYYFLNIGDHSIVDRY